MTQQNHASSPAEGNGSKTYDQAEIEARLSQDQRDLIYKLMHPEGDPYGNARDLGFYCEQCG